MAPTVEVSTGTHFSQLEVAADSQGGIGLSKSMYDSTASSPRVNQTPLLEAVSLGANTSSEESSDKAQSKGIRDSRHFPLQVVADKESADDIGPQRTTLLPLPRRRLAGSGRQASSMIECPEAFRLSSRPVSPSPLLSVSSLSLIDADQPDTKLHQLKHSSTVASPTFSFQLEAGCILSKSEVETVQRALEYVYYLRLSFICLHSGR
ncbi:unnamed protein product [Protopolystoma xenopodis]|uniref:Uncharacterized protein n=1 Tax=Protopolystoma xenopodis TaxID=117903 RepID=A0A3S5CSS2_9PLAT|nr:unnamed protein product [Protopolystoma xenopodis]